MKLGQKKLTPELAGLIVRILADAEATFAPIRHNEIDAHAAAAILELRQQYATAGVPAVGGGAAAARLSHSRLLMQARFAGLLELSGTNTAGRWAKLTPRGESTARAICALPTIQTSFALLSAIESAARLGTND